MIRAYYESVCAGRQVRENLIALRGALREEKNKRALAYLAGGDFAPLCGLLADEDPKVRKNAALILGEMESEDLLPVLFEAYKNEQTRFVRADYLRAIAKLDYRPWLDELQSRLEELRGADLPPEEQKHAADELRVLQEMVLRCRGAKRHRFSGYQEKPELVLVVNRCQRQATAEQIREGSLTMLAGGIRVKDAKIGDILPVRTYSELLFPLEAGLLPADRPELAGEALAQPALEKACALHEGEPPFLFRVELKSRMEAGRRGVWIRRAAHALEQASRGALINSVSEYELELRLLERRDGTLAAFLRLFTIPDRRFAYRKEYVASSIAPVNAALAVQLARPYLKERAHVLDPFCGVGTMLIERNLALPAEVMYGVDVYGEAIEKAKRNTELAGCSVYYINKDFFAFAHKYLFDEVITDMPQVTAGHPEREIRRLYQDFFGRIGRYLEEEAVLVVYAAEPEFLTEAVRTQPRFRIAERFLLNEKSGASVFVIRREAPAR